MLGFVGPSEAAIAHLTVETARRAGVLRGTVTRTSHHDISAIDAQVVAIAEQRSYDRVVTIVTSDLNDIMALVVATRRTNIGIDVV
jgi:hypothetical protein